MPGLGNHLRKAMISLRTDDNVDHLRAPPCFGAFRLRDAAGEGDQRPGAVLTPEASDLRIRLFGRFLADMASVQDDEIGIVAAAGSRHPLFREELVGDTYQLFADRSVTNTSFTQGRSQGVQLGYEGDSFRFFGAFSDGLQTANTDFNSASEADYAFTGRLEWKWAGNWKQANDFTSFQNSDYFGVVGFAAHYQNGGDTFATQDFSSWGLTADLSMEGNGWNLFAAVIYSNFDPNSGSNLADWAFQVQGGVFVAPQWELIAGWDILIPDTDRSNNDNFSTFRIGANHYFIPESHAAKLTIDFTWFLDDQSQSIAVPNTLTGLLVSNNDSQWNLRGQIQLMF